MKIRNGFVSNSSSSSFIVGIAKINDFNVLQKYINDHHIKLGYDIKILTLSEINNNYSHSIKILNNYINVDSFQTSVDIPINNYKDSDLFLIVNITNDQGDSSFNNDGWDIDYDIDISWFSDDQASLYSAFFNEESGLDIINSSITYGAGRNG